MEHDLLTADEVAALLRVNRSTVSRWTKAGVLRATRLGPRMLRFRRADVVAFLEGRDPTESVAAGQ